MLFAYVGTRERGGTDRLLHGFAKTCLARGLNVAGVVQTNTPRPKSVRCDMDVEVLPDGPIIRISQDLGPEARGCALDPEALMRAVGEVQTRLTADTQLLIINKFGKHEAEGKGFRDLIGEATSLGVPVLAGVNPMNVEAFSSFAGGLAVEVDASEDALTDWLRACSYARLRA